MGAILVAMLATPTAPSADDRAAPATVRELTAEGACDRIRDAIRTLAKSERDQALALDLVARGGSTAIVETRLNDLLERSGDLRTILASVRLNRIADDQYVEQCLTTGFRSLVDAERLSSDVEEVLFGAEGNPRAGATTATVRPPVPRSAAPPPAPPP